MQAGKAGVSPAGTVVASDNSRAQGTAVVPRREQHMSFKSKVLAGAASLALVSGVAVVGGLSASAATPSCGPDCINIFSREFGTHAHPNFVMDVFRQGAKVGQPIILFKASNSDPAEDFTVAFMRSAMKCCVWGLIIRSSSATRYHVGFDFQAGAGAGS